MDASLSLETVTPDPSLPLGTITPDSSSLDTVTTSDRSVVDSSSSLLDSLSLVGTSSGIRLLQQSGE